MLWEILSFFFLSIYIKIIKLISYLSCWATCFSFLLIRGIFIKRLFKVIKKWIQGQKYFVLIDSSTQWIRLNGRYKAKYTWSKISKLFNTKEISFKNESSFTVKYYILSNYHNLLFVFSGRYESQVFVVKFEFIQTLKFETLIGRIQLYTYIVYICKNMETLFLFLSYVNDKFRK